MGLFRSKHLFLPLVSLCVTAPLFSATITVTTTADSGAGSLRNAMTSAGPGDTINFSLPASSTITLTSGDLPVIGAALTIDGSTATNLTISGTDTSRIFFVNASGVTIQNVTLASGNATGGAGGLAPGTTTPSGGGGGGGGLGAGGAIFVTDTGAVTLNNVGFTNNKAVGGTGGNGGLFFCTPPSPDPCAVGGGGGGGGGLSGSGGVAGTTSVGSSSSSGGGGGGGYNVSPLAGTAGGNDGGIGGDGGDGGNGGGGAAGGFGGFLDGGGNGSAGSNGTAGTTLGQGGGGGGGQAGSDPAFIPFQGGNGAAGFDYGGGGGGGGGGGDTGAVGGSGADGGFGGGGGGAGTSGNISGSGPFFGGLSGGDGGFGAGGGGGGGGTSTFGGGTGANGNTADGGGGSGAAFGGALFIREGGQVTISGAVSSLSGNNVLAGTAGNGATAGAVAGLDFFMMSGSQLNFALTSDLTISTNIAADNLNVGGGLTLLSGSTATLTLTGTNTYIGNTLLQGGTLNISGNTSTGASPSIELDGGKLQAGTTFTLAVPTTLTSASTIGSGGNVFTIPALSGVGPLTKADAGTLILATGNTYSSGTHVSGGILRIADTSSGNVTLAAGTTLQLGASIATFTPAIAIGASSIIDTNGFSTTLGAAITGTGPLLKNSTGTLTLASGNTFSGGTQLNGGTLAIVDNTPGAISIAAGSTLQTNATIANYSSSITVAAGSVINTNGSNLTLTAPMGGVGPFTKAGVGTLALSTNNTFSNGVQVSAGILQILDSTSGPVTLSTGSTLQAGASIANFTPVITLAGNSAINTGAFNMTLGSAMVGVGPLNKTGAGILTLAAGNSYTGGTQIVQGTIAVVDNLSGAMTITTNGTLQANATIANFSSAITIAANATINTNGFNLTLTSPIGGTGPLVKLGAGTLALATGNTFSNGVQVSTATGVLQVSDSSSGPVTLASGAGLQFGASLGTFTPLVTIGNNSFINTNGFTVALAQGIAGSGTLIKNGTGMLTLAASNLYTGGTQVNAGTLNIRDTSADTITLAAGTTLQAGASFDNDQLLVLNGSSTFDANGFDSAFSNTISGTGPLNLINSGAAADVSYLGTIQTYTEGTVIGNAVSLLVLGAPAKLPSGENVTINSGGVLRIDGGALDQTIGDLSGAGELIVNGALTNFNFGTSNNTSFTGPLIGSGIMNKMGSGTFTVTDTSSLINRMNVMQGAVVVSGILFSRVEVSSGAFLRGNGSVSTLINNGTVAPGNSIGTLTVLNDYSQSSSGNLQIEINATGQSDLLAVGGAATLDGALTVVPLSGSFFDGTSYTILTADGGVTGTFSSNNLETLPASFSIAYEVNAVRLLVSGNSFFNYQEVTRHNPRMVADNLEANVTSAEPDLFNIVTQLDTLDSSQLTSALDKMHPALFGAFGLVRESNATNLTTMLVHHPEELCCLHMADSCGCDTTSIWLQPYEQVMTVKPTNQQKGFNAQTTGFVLGADHCLPYDLAVGIGTGYSYSNIDWMQSNGTGYFHSVFGGAYLDWMGDHGFVNFSTVGAGDRFHATRHIYFPGLNRRAKSSHSGGEFATHLGGGYDFKVGNAFIRPFANEDYFYLYEKGFEESGAQGLNLVVGDRHTKYLRSEVGLSFSRSYKWHGGCWAPTVSVSYVNLHPFGTRNYTTRFTELSEEFTVWTFNKTWNLVSPAFDLTFNLNNGLSLSARYRGEMNGVYHMNQGDFRFEWNF